MDRSVAALCAAAESALLSGQVAHAAELLGEALALAADGASRTDVLCLRARLSVVTGDRSGSVAELHAAATELRDDRPDLAARLLVEAVILMLYDRRTDALAVAMDAHTLARDSDPIVRTQADAALGLAYVFAGDPQNAAHIFPTGSQLVRLGGSPQQVVHVVQYIIVGLSGLERYAESMALCRQYVAAVRSVSAEGLLPFMLCLLANTAYFTAEFDAMEMAANEALALAASQRQDAVVVFAEICLALVLAVRGEVAEARRRAEAALVDVPRTGMQAFVPTATVALGLADMAEGDWPAAAGRYQAVRDFLVRTAQVSGVLHWRADAIEALWRAGRTADAAAQLAELRGSLPGEGPWEQAAAARAAALLADGADADALFAEALRLHAQSPSTFERARTELCWGESLAARDRPEPARGHLESARAEFARLGARPWADRARALLTGLDAEVALAPAVGDLTPAPEPDATVGPPTHVRAFGPLTLIRGGVETRIAMDTAGRALRYLVASGGSVHAEALIDELWPDAEPGFGSGRLRTVLARTRARYGPVLVRDGTIIRWADGVTVDVQRFSELARAALGRPRDAHAVSQARQAIALYSTDLLPLERYTEWAAATRERLRQRYLDLLVLLADDAVERDDPAAAMGYARDIVDADPLDEEAYLRLARLQLDAGRVGAARETVARAERAAAELGLRPSAALAALAQRIGHSGR